MNNPSGTTLLYWYLNGKCVIDGVEKIAGEDEKHDIHVGGILASTIVSVRDMETAAIKDYCAAVVLVAIHRLRHGKTAGAIGGLTKGLDMISRVSQDVAGQLPRNVLWSALKIAAAASGDEQRLQDAARQITTADQPADLDQLEAYIRTHFPQPN